MIDAATRTRLRRPAVVLLALNAAAFVAFTFPRALQARNVAHRVAALRAEVERERAQVQALRERADTIARNGRDSERLFGEFLKPRNVALLPAIEEIHAAAEAEGIELGSETFAPAQAEGGRPASVRVEMPVKGSYRQIVGFLARLERSRHFLVVEGLTLGASEPGEASLGVTISAYFRDARPEDAGA
ncbi:MAG TPA: GspMb/PilO family protein [Vicinamibacteria bacterium]|nr:GspMb/PilO family protein [Vicinamibacteria bacterium]